MTIIEVYGPLREKLGWSKKQVHIASDKTTLARILEEVGLKEIILDEKEQIREGYIVLINGIHAQFKGHGKAIVRNEDTISIFPPGGGG